VFFFLSLPINVGVKEWGSRFILNEFFGFDWNFLECIYVLCPLLRSIYRRSFSNNESRVHMMRLFNYLTSPHRNYQIPTNLSRSSTLSDNIHSHLSHAKVFLRINNIHRSCCGVSLWLTQSMIGRADVAIDPWHSAVTSSYDINFAQNLCVPPFDIMKNQLCIQDEYLIDYYPEYQARGTTHYHVIGWINEDSA
jgi:hypothetical protein